MVDTIRARKVKYAIYVPTTCAPMPGRPADGIARTKSGGIMFAARESREPVLDREEFPAADQGRTHGGRSLLSMLAEGTEKKTATQKRPTIHLIGVSS